DGLSTGAPADASRDNSPGVGGEPSIVEPSPNAADAAEASDAVDASLDAGPWCTGLRPAPVFCLDFDEGDLTKAYQSGALIFAPTPEVCLGCTASIGVDGPSSPGAFLAEFPSMPSGGSLHNYYNQPVAVSATGASLRFDMRLLTLQVGQEVDFASH